MRSAWSPSQIIFAVNFIGSMFFGKRSRTKSLGCQRLEWMAPSPPGHGNFDFQPVVYRGPYEYGSPEVEQTFTRKTNRRPSSRLTKTVPADQS